MKKLLIEACRKEKDSAIHKEVGSLKGFIDHNGDRPDAPDAAYIGHLVTQMLLNNDNIGLIRIFISE